MRQEIKERIERIKKGEVPEGFHKTEIGKIPQEWDTKQLKNIGEIITGNTPSTKTPEYYGDEYMFVSPADISDKKYVYSTSKNLSIEGFKVSRELPQYTIMMTCIGSTIGKIAMTTNKVATNQQINSIIPNKMFDNNYVYYSLDFYFSKIKNSIIEHQAVPIINKTKFSELYLPNMKLAEQQKIASILSTWDKAIELKEQLIEQKIEQKRGLMKKLLSGEVRLPGFDDDWKEVKLGEIGSFLKGKGISKSEVIDEGIPCIRYGEIYTTHDNFIKEFKSFISRNVALTSERIYKGDILFAGSGETQEEIGKSVAYINDDEAYAGGDIVILRPKKSNNIYLGYALNGELFNIQKRKLGQGHSVVHIYSKDLKEISIPIPELAEQEKIAEILKKSGQEISLLKQELEALKLQKKGLMQLLLTGIVRVQN